ncbi:(myosin heavy-chain) kinase [Actinomadura verrucosospora]|uniref:(Myosin heavy-chain) kinase n=1 Tax=Actinomadura verrucosospora TaxID=46165 RepID=A0A7D3VUF0_ACTVE|nr:(myosin heavy-chain) kinase [Actinomadura verrucosospora]
MLLDVTGGQSTPIPLGEHSSPVTSYAISPDSARLAAGCQDGTIWLWDLNVGAAEQRPDPRRVPSSSCAAAPDGSWLATTDDNWQQGRIAIWDVTTGQQSRVCGAGAGRYDSCVAAPDGTWLATARSDAVLIWEVATGRLRHHIECPVRPGHVLISAATNYVIDLTVAPDGTWLAAACEDGTVRLLDLATGQTRDILDHPAITGRMLSCVVAPDASWLAYSGLDATVIHDLPSGTNRKIDSSSRLLDVSPDGSLLASEQGFDIRVWAAATGETVHVLGGHTHFVKTCRWSPDGTRLASAGDHTVRIWATATGGIETTVRLYADPNDSRNPMDCSWLSNGRTLAVTSKQGLHLFDLTNTPSDLIDPVPHRVDRSPASLVDPQQCDETLDAEGPGCSECGGDVARAGTGRPRRYCSRACRQRAYRARTR